MSAEHTRAHSPGRPGRARLADTPLAPLPKLTLLSDKLFAALTVFQALLYSSSHRLISGIWKYKQAGCPFMHAEIEAHCQVHLTHQILESLLDLRDIQGSLSFRYWGKAQ